MVPVNLALVSPIGLVLEGAVSAHVGVKAHDLMARRSQADAGEIIVLSAPACKIFTSFRPFQPQNMKNKFVSEKLLEFRGVRW